jgi:hypothetical protein
VARPAGRNGPCDMHGRRDALSVAPGAPHVMSPVRGAQPGGDPAARTTSTPAMKPGWRAAWRGGLAKAGWGTARDDPVAMPRRSWP